MKKDKGQYVTPAMDIVEVQTRDFLCSSPGPYSAFFLTMDDRDDYDKITTNPFGNN